MVAYQFKSIMHLIEYFKIILHLEVRNASVHLYPMIDVELPIRIRCSSQLWMNSSALPSSIVLRQLASVLSSSSDFNSAHELIGGEQTVGQKKFL